MVFIDLSPAMKGIVCPLCPKDMHHFCNHRIRLTVQETPVVITLAPDSMSYMHDSIRRQCFMDLYKQSLNERDHKRTSKEFTHSYVGPH